MFLRFLRCQFSTLFGKRPIVGEIYAFNRDGDPFAETWKVKVLAVKNGYVQYRNMQNCDNIESKEVAVFYFCYDLVEATK